MHPKPKTIVPKAPIHSQMAQRLTKQLRIPDADKPILRAHLPRPIPIPRLPMGNLELQQPSLQQRLPKNPRQPPQPVTPNGPPKLKTLLILQIAATLMPVRPFQLLPLRFLLLQPHLHLQLLHPPRAVHHPSLVAPREEDRPRRPPLLRHRRAV
jgi:hypothetical protein